MFAFKNALAYFCRSSVAKKKVLSDWQMMNCKDCLVGGRKDCLISV
jgi:hypothetical protein